MDLLPSGLFEVPDEHTVLGPKGVRLTKSKALLGYVLAQYIDGDEAEPTITATIPDSAVPELRRSR